MSAKRRSDGSGWLVWDFMRLPGCPFESKAHALIDRKSTRLNSSHLVISYAVFCLKKKNGSDGWRRPLGHRRLDAAGPRRAPGGRRGGAVDRTGTREESFLRPPGTFGRLLEECCCC